MARRAGDEHRSAPLGISQGIAGVPQDEDPALAEVAGRAVGDRASTDDGQPGGVQFRGELGARVPLDFHHRVPGAGQAVEQETMSPRPRQDDPGAARVEMPGHFRVDPRIFADLGDRHDGRRRVR
jgi:hypothetical protein